MSSNRWLTEREGDPRPHGSRCGQLALAAVLLFLLPGCMHRRFTVRSDPPGALVMVDGEEIGYTPCSLDYTYYGTREIRLIKDGFETLTVKQPLTTPWYQVFPLEFVSDNLALRKINDYRDFSYRLQPQVIVPTQELFDRARNLRAESNVSR